MNAEPKTAHEVASETIVALCRRNPAVWDTTAYQHGITANMLYNRHYSALFNAIGERRRANQDMHDTELLALCGDMPQTFYSQIMNVVYGDNLLDRRYERDVLWLKDYGRKVVLKTQLQAALKALNTGDVNLESITAQLQVDIQYTASNGISGETAAELADAYDAMLAQPSGKLFRTGIQWVDSLSRGIELGHLWWFVGAYKHRKTSTMLAVILGLLMTAIRENRSDVSIAFLSREMERLRIVGQLIAMLAASYLIEHGWYNLTFDTPNGHTIAMNAISAHLLNSMGKEYRNRMHPKQVEAIDYGRRVWREMGEMIRIYDTSDIGGGLEDVPSIERLVYRDMKLYNGTIFALDYMQLIDAPGKTAYDQATYISRQLQKIVKREKVTMLVAAQRNEETIKGKGKGYSPGVTGGGAAAQTADYMIVTEYNVGSNGNPEQLNLNMRLNRHGKGGENEKEFVNIHAGSGLILESNWIKRGI